jgi:tetratricopeptide (TPR) repeat protein
MPRLLTLLLEQAFEMAKAGKWDDRAFEINQRITVLVPDNSGAHARLGRCHLERGDTDQAIQAYERALMLNPGSEVVKKVLQRLQTFGYGYGYAEDSDGYDPRADEWLDDDDWYADVCDEGDEGEGFILDDEEYSYYYRSDDHADVLDPSGPSYADELAGSEPEYARVVRGASGARRIGRVRGTGLAR